MKKAAFLFMVLLICGRAYAVPSPAPAQAAASREEVQKLLEKIEAKMRPVETMQAKFLQHKKLSLFERVIELRGSIAMQKPDRFAWRTESPLRYTIVADSRKVSQWDEDTKKVETVSFSSSPVVRMIVTQMQTWFYGAYGKLMEQYEITQVSKDPIVLKFVPLETSPAYGMVASVKITFRSDLKVIQTIAVEENNGDISSIDFRSPVLNAKINPDVWKADHV